MKELNNFISEISIEENFWKINPHFKYLTDFKDLYANDKSKDKYLSSRKMWGVVLYTDINSPWKRMGVDKRKEEVMNYASDQFTFEEIEPLIKKYESNCMTEKQRAFMNYTKQMWDRDNFINSTPYKPTSYKMLEELRKNTAALWKDYERIEASMVEELYQEQIKGGRKKSKSELKVI